MNADFGKLPPHWRPKRNGVYFCSAGCGSHKFCLHADYLHVKKRAEELAASLGEGWKPKVWENLGWFGAVTKGRAEIHLNDHRRGHTNYMLYFNVYPQIVLTGPHPAALWEKGLKTLRTQVELLAQEYLDHGGVV